eukprot:240824_1
MKHKKKMNNNQKTFATININLIVVMIMSIWYISSIIIFLSKIFTCNSFTFNHSHSNPNNLDITQYNLMVHEDNISIGTHNKRRLNISNFSNWLFRITSSTALLNGITASIGPSVAVHGILSALTGIIFALAGTFLALTG